MQEELKPPFLVLDVIEPGTWLVGHDQEWCSRIKRLLDELEGQFFDANIALNLFTGAAAMIRARHDRASRLQDFRRRSEISEQVRRDLAASSASSLDDVRVEAERLFRAEQLAQGREPSEFQLRECLISARAFVSAVDLFEKLLGVLSVEPDVPPELIALHREVSDAFPDLRAVRNSVQHHEDRARGLGAGRAPKLMELKPVETASINAPGGGVLVLNSLEGTKYCTVMADGHLGQIDVSADSLYRLQGIINKVLQLFRWEGPARRLPQI